MKLFERSSKDSAILRRDFQKNAAKSRRFAQHDTRAGGVADDDVALLNHAHDAVLPLSAQKRHAKSKADDAAPRGVMKITAYDDEEDDDDDDDDLMDDNQFDDGNDDDNNEYALPEDDSEEKRQQARAARSAESVSNQWGSRKHAYYGTDYRDEEHSTSDEAEALEEEAEVNLLEARKARGLSAADFGNDGDDSDDGGRDADAADAKGPQTEAELVSRVNAELDEIDFDMDAAGDEVGVERIDRDISRLTPAEKLKALKNDAPELLQLLDDFCESVDELAARLAPVVELAREANGGQPSAEGISFLDIKFHLLLNYCTNVAFYMLLKAEGRAVRDHPVILQLVKTRTMLEKLRPLDKKLSYQIDKLLKLAQSVEGGDEAEMLAAATEVSADPLRFKPRAGLLMTDDDGGDDGGDNYDDADADDDSGDGDDDESAASDDAQVAKSKRGGKYVPPRHTAVPYEEEEGAKPKAVSERDRRRAVQSEMAKFVLAEFGDEPEEEMAVHGGAYEEGDRSQKSAELRDYEESNFVRLMLSKKDAKARVVQLRNEVKVLDDFTDLDALGGGGGGGGGDDDDGGAPSEGLPKGRQSSLSKLVSSLDVKNRAIAAKLSASADADAPYKEKARRLPKVVDAGAEDDDDAEREPTLEDNRVYQKSLAQHAGKKRGADDALFQSSIAVDEDAKRAVGKRIEKNRGLVRPRNEKRKTPRTGMRNRMDDATKKRKSVVPVARAEEGPYEGERNGVKSTVVRSRKLTR